MWTARWPGAGPGGSRSPRLPTARVPAPAAPATTTGLLLLAPAETFDDPRLRRAVDRRRVRRRQPGLARLPAAARRPGRGRGPAGALQLLGGDRLRRRTSRQLRAGRARRAAGRRAVRGGRRLVRRPATTTAPGSATGRPTRTASPHGLEPLVDEVHALGMRFGIWVEPEMVNPDSDLYRAHPDWVLHHAGPRRGPNSATSWCSTSPAPDVRRAPRERLDAPAARARHRLREVGLQPAASPTPAGPASATRERLWIGPRRGRLRAHRPAARRAPRRAHRGRAPAAAAGPTSASWPAPTRSGPRTTPTRSTGCGIQHGFSQLYPARVMAAWVTDSPEHALNRPRSSAALPVRHVAMAGVLGHRRRPRRSGARRSWPRPPDWSRSTRRSGRSCSTATSTGCARPGRRPERRAVRARRRHRRPRPGCRRSPSACRRRRCGCAASTRPVSTATGRNRRRAARRGAAASRPEHRTERRSRCDGYPPASHLTVLSEIAHFIPTGPGMKRRAGSREQRHLRDDVLPSAFS